MYRMYMGGFFKTINALGGMRRAVFRRALCGGSGEPSFSRADIWNTGSPTDKVAAPISQ